MIEIEILYADFTKSDRVPIEQAASLRKDGVLFISLSTEWGNRKALVTRMWNRRNRFDAEEKWHGGDHYAVGFYGEFFFVDQWDDMDDHLHIRRLDDPHGRQMNTPRGPRHPKDAVIHKFKGAWVPIDKWLEALKIFDSEMF